MRNVSDKTCRENCNTYLTLFFSENHAVYEINVEKYDTARHAINENTILSRKEKICMPDN
jgi:hypothetical protein